MKYFFLFLGLIFTSSLYAIPTVTVSIAPQKYFVEQIAKNLVLVNVMVEAGSSSHTYEPKPMQMKAISTSDAYFTIGDGFEKAWLPRFQSTNVKMIVVDTTEGISKITMKGHHHDGEKETHHDEAMLDPHIWLDPVLVKIQATHIYNALCTLYPSHVKEFEANYHVFMKSLDTLDEQIKLTLKHVKNRSFIVFHPSFGYFAARYGLEQIAIEVSGKEPKPQELATLIREAKEENVKVIFVSPQFSHKSAQQIAQQVGAKVVAIDPLSAAWYDNLLHIATLFQSEL